MVELPIPVLLVEDDTSLRRVFTAELQDAGFVVRALPSGDGALTLLAQEPVDAVVLDLNLPGQHGMLLLAQMLQQDGDLQIVVCTGNGDVATAVAAMRAGAFDFLTKPVGLDVLEQTLRRAAQHARLLRENRRLRLAAATSPTGEVACPSDAAQRLDRAIERVAQSTQPVLIQGESGTGKELVARKLHALSPRHDRPFVVVNCGAVPRQLIESELFGHKKGAFTGADQGREGLFEAADGGTLFLDEVAELPLELQPALLRAIQFGEVRPVGSDRSTRVDVRIVAATHRDLRAWIADGRFREDLYYRLSVLELRTPPLRERAADVPVLARAFLQREAARAGRPLQFDDAALQRLAGHAWRGNVRELENAVVRLAVLANGPQVTAGDVDELAFGTRTVPSTATDPPLPTLQVRELERLAIQEAMRRFAGNKRKAAEALGIALKTLYNKLEAYAGGAGAADADAADADAADADDDEPTAG